MTIRWIPVLIAVAASATLTGAPPALAAASIPPAPFVRHVADAADPEVVDWPAIQRIIDEQLAALRRGDATRAFAYASTGIRDQFDDATTFLSMVRQRYGVLLTARYTEFLEGAVIDGHTLQPLRLVMNDDTVLVAIYEMQRDERGGWRIAGCFIAPSTVRST
ncbi:MAG TPA: DUF4864 domain-containing protein [Casimicrobiaceae bacterium]|nr:DUF4864 domain-containing protein [Casimicrobiaceae bacterium]